MKRLWKLQPKMCGALLFGIACLPSMAFADDGVYMNIHTTGTTSVQSLSLDDIDKFTFSSSAMDVKLKDKTNVSVLYNNLWKLTFGEKEQIGAVETLKNDLDSLLSIRYQSTNKTIVVESSSPIESIGVYNLQGVLKYQASPRVETLSLPIDDYPSGIYIIYIIYVNNGATVKTEKIIKR